MLFLSIAMFGYFALHLRIIHSSSTLEQRQAMRRLVETAQVKAWTSGNPPASGNFPLTAPAANSYAQDFEMGESALSGNTLVKAEASPSGLYRVEHQLQWTNRHGQQSYRMDSYLREKDAGW